MGGEQSHERKADEKGEETEEHQKPAQTDRPGAAAEDAPGELPQCQMGNKKVDNMCFMISCTNWY